MAWAGRRYGWESGFLRCAAHKRVSSFGRNDGSLVVEGRTGNGEVWLGKFYVPTLGAWCRAEDGAPRQFGLVEKTATAKDTQIGCECVEGMQLVTAAMT